MKQDVLPRWLLSRWLTGGEWRAHPIRAIVTIGAIAIGVALGFAIDLINTAAFNEFSAAAKSLSGQSDLQVRASQPFFDETLYPLLTQHDGVALASPILELNAVVPGEKNTLKIIGTDVFRAAGITPGLIGIPAENRPFDTLADDAIFLSPSAMEWLKRKPGDSLSLRSGTEVVTLRVAGNLLHARAGQRIAVMDIGAAQWRFRRIGQLSRIDLKLIPGINRDTFKTVLAHELPKYLVTETEDQETRTANMSRAYRVNLNMLAMVALFTGAFLVFSTQALSVIRRRHQFALLRVIGLTRRQLVQQVLLEGATLGILGSLSGLVLGYGFAAIALYFFGGDLGGGYFSGVKPVVQWDSGTALLFLLLGSGISLLGSASPAWEAARAKPAHALKSGSEEEVFSKLATLWPAFLCLALGVTLTQLPPIAGLPVFGYLAVAFLLIGGITLMPRFSALFFPPCFGLSPDADFRSINLAP